MQQTNIYRLNKIDMDDTFSTAPLNENMDKVETALSLMDGANTALRSRLATLEGRKIAVGVYTGSGDLQTVQVGFRPRAVIIQATYQITGDCFLATAAGGCATMADTGFSLSGGNHPNSLGGRYAYVAIS